MKPSWRNLQFKTKIRAQDLLEGVILLLLALCPILQHYKGLIDNPSKELTIVIAAYALVKLFIRKGEKIRIGGIMGLVLYGLYVSVIHGFSFSALGREMAQVGIFLAAFNGVLDLRKFLRICTWIALAATVCIVVQYFCYYVLGFHLQLVATNLLSESAEQWIGLAQTGRINVSGKTMAFYRPSAFFLEPSHFAIFCIPVVCVLLLSKDSGRKEFIKAAVISAGVLLTTSGLGLVAIGAMWLLFVAFYLRNTRKNKKFVFSDILKPHSLLLILVIGGVFLVLYSTSSVFRQSVNRIFISSASGATAITGRTSTGIRALKMLSASTMWTGFGSRYSVHDWNMSAFFLTVFFHGVIGGLLFYWFYVRSLFHVRHAAFWMCVIFIGLSFFTVHMYAAYYRIFYTLVILQGYVLTSEVPKTQAQIITWREAYESSQIVS